MKHFGIIVIAGSLPDFAVAIIRRAAYVEEELERRKYKEELEQARAEIGLELDRITIQSRMLDLETIALRDNSFMAEMRHKTKQQKLHNKQAVRHYNNQIKGKWKTKYRK